MTSTLVQTNRSINRNFQIYLSTFLFIPLISGYSNIVTPIYYRSNINAKSPHPLRPLRTNLNRTLTNVFEARQLEFTFPSEEEQHAAVADGRYNSSSVLPVDMDVYHPQNGPTQIFLTIPRFDRGSPYTLARVIDGNRLEPYPNYSWHSSYGTDCDGLTSVYRIMIDECNRMWIVDSGEIGRNHLCQPQVVVIDLPTQTLVSRYRLPENVFRRNVSRLVTIMVDIADPPPKGHCHEAMAYIADPTAYSIIVYDAVRQKTWRVENAFTYPSPNFSTHTIAGESFELMDGTFGFALTPKGLGLRRMLYFHSLSNDLQVAVPLDIINNATNFERQGLTSSLHAFLELGRRGVQCSISAMTPEGYLLCGFFEPIALVAWDIRKPYTAANRIVLAENRQTLQFIGGLKIMPNKQGKQEVWLLTNRAQKFFAGTNNYNEINYRVMKCGLDELLAGKPCVP